MRTKAWVLATLVAVTSLTAQARPNSLDERDEVVLDNRGVVFCLPGTYASGGTCKPCPKGQYQDNYGQSSCKPCSEGKYQDAEGKTTCKNCDSNKYSTGGAETCQKCDDGSVPNSGRTGCNPCAPGVAVSGDRTCTTCPAGRVANDEKNKCVCKDGYKADAGRQTCSPCGAGTYPNTAQTACVNCTPGTFSPGGKKTCDECATGEYSGSGATVCRDTCDHGSRPKADKTGCESCGDKAIGDGKTCTNCDPGEKPNVEKTECKACNDNEFGDGSSCTECTNGQVPKDDKTGCKSCEGIFVTNNAGSACVADCGDDADVDPDDPNSCKCKAPGATFSIEQDGTRTCGCGDGGAKLSDDGESCECMADGARFTVGSNGQPNTCECAGGATLSGDGLTCECDTSGADYSRDEESGEWSCSCPKEKPITSDSNKCVPDCGDNGRLDSEDNCVCKADGADFHAGTDGAPGTCTCGDGAALSSSGLTCECDANEATYDTVEKKCSCPEGAAFDNDGKCKCDAPKNSVFTKDETTGEYSCGCPPEKPIENEHGVCVPDCGDDAALDGEQCACKADGADFHEGTGSNPGTCTCGDGAALSETGDECECDAEFATYDTDAKSCSCPTIAPFNEHGECECTTKDAQLHKDPTSGEYSCDCPPDKPVTNSDNECVAAPPDCGPNGKIDENTHECTCKADDATYNDKVCTCGKGATLNSEGTECTCPEGASLENGDCKCDPEKGTVLEQDAETHEWSCNCPPDKPVIKDGVCSPRGPDPPACGDNADEDPDTHECTCKAEGANYHPLKQTCSCGPGRSGATLSQDGKSCICDVSDATWMKDANDRGKYKCLCSNGKKPKNGVCPTPPPTCGDGSRLVKGECVCWARGAELQSDKSCSCGPDAGLSTDKKSCVCTDTNAKWTKGSNGKYSCVCPKGQTLKDGVCTKPEPECGKDATKKKGHCVCNAPGAIFKSDKTCSCGPHASLTGKKCVCHATGASWTKSGYGEYSCTCPKGQILKNNACVKPPPPCGNGATRKNGVCTCRAPGAILRKSDQSCGCGPKAHLSKDGSRCQCLTKGASWTKDGYGKYSCQCRPGQVERNGVCQNVPKCGRQASLKNGVCKCNNPNLLFNSKQQTCGCGTEATLNSKGTNCHCRKTGMQWGVVSHTCACPRGMEYRQGRCQKVKGGYTHY